MKNFSIEKANLADLEALVALFDGYRVFYGKDSDVDGARGFLRERLIGNDSVILFAAFDGTACGFTQLYPSFSSVSMQRLWILNDLFVDSRFRQRGVASKLMAAAESWARSTNAKGLVLQTERDNAPAQRLYAKRGWQKDQLTYYYEWFPN